MLNIHWQPPGSWGVVGRAFTAALSERLPVAVIGGDRGMPSPPPAEDGLTLNFGEWWRARRLPGRKVITYMPWETTRIPWPRARGIRRLDHLWVPSGWQREIFIRNGIDARKIRVVPLGFDPAIFHPATEPRPDDGVFRFLMVGKWEVRKAVPLLVEAFAREFSQSENVELVLHAHNPFRADFDSGRAVRKILLSLGLPDRRIHCAGGLPGHELGDAYRNADAFVLPTRSEGWGLPLLEAMACGLPCITTGYSGLTAFAHEGNAMLIRVEKLVRVRDRFFFNPLLNWGRWAEPDAAHLRGLMRRLFEDRAAARTLGAAAAAEVSAKWTWRHAAEVAVRELERI